jgi:hypothetical protein
MELQNIKIKNHQGSQEEKQMSTFPPSETSQKKFEGP